MEADVQTVRRGAHEIIQMCAASTLKSFSFDRNSRSVLDLNYEFKL